MRIRSKLSRAEMIEKYDIMGEIERNKRSKGGIVIDQAKTNVDLYIDDVRAILNAQETEFEISILIFHIRQRFFLVHTNKQLKMGTKGINC